MRRTIIGLLLGLGAFTVPAYAGGHTGNVTTRVTANGTVIKTRTLSVRPLDTMTTVVSPNGTVTKTHSLRVLAPKPPGDQVIGGPGTDSCLVHSSVGRASDWSWIRGRAWTDTCTGAAACYNTADLQAFQAQRTGHWVTIKEGSQVESCTGTVSGTGQVSCQADVVGWSYRNLNLNTIFWNNGQTTNDTTLSGTLSGDHVC